MNGALDIGRIVRVRIRNTRGELVERPAIVVRKWEDHVGNMHVFPDESDFFGNAPQYVSSCTHGWGERQWHWHDETEPGEVLENAVAGAAE